MHDLYEFNKLYQRPGYFEQQFKQNCAVHALNNMIQCELFSSEFLNICAEYLTKNVNKNSKFKIVHYDANGNYDTEVIETALTRNGFKFENLFLENLDEYFNNNEPFMFIITYFNHHFSARRFTQNGDIWIFDSEMEAAIIDSSIKGEQLQVCLYNLIINSNKNKFCSNKIPLITSVFVTENVVPYKEHPFISSNLAPVQKNKEYLSYKLN